MTFLAKIRKAIVAVLGLAGILVSTGLLHGQTLTIVNAVIAAGTALSVYLVPNKTTSPASGPSVAEAILGAPVPVAVDPVVGPPVPEPAPTEITATVAPVAGVPAAPNPALTPTEPLAAPPSVPPAA